MKTCLSTLALSLCLFLAACGGDEKIGVSYLGLNYTDKNIVSVVVNGEGGILDVPAQGGGGGIVCCVVIPKKWRPGLKVTIKWQEDDIPVFDDKGKRVIKNGIPVVIESPWKERTVEVPDYKTMASSTSFSFPMKWSRWRSVMDSRPSRKHLTRPPDIGERHDNHFPRLLSQKPPA